MFNVQSSKPKPGTRNPEQYARKARAQGFTMVEAIVVIAITGVVAAATASFIRAPIQGYVDAARRAELTDQADTALRRMTRDIRTALPNSIRVTSASGVAYLEYLQTSSGGRYRAEVDSGGAGNVLDFTSADASFDVIGPMPAFAAGDSIVVYNLNSAPLITTSNAYFGDNRAAYASATASNITLAAAKLFPFSSPGKRFQVVQYAVTYACNPGTGELRRYWNYGITTAQPTPPVTANNALLAQNVTSCSFTYNEVNQRTAALALNLQLTEGGESVRLFQQVHINNVP
jgi:MSHA biogenesis protein MshO